ncbi:MAG: hypothetical protein LKG25_05330 [Prevotella sp.]|jgi:hypothetical protein|nr:hypothetical protein [Prevotella sp.]MCI1281998.1 hypothetical protein [Prevotella sp.]
MKKESKKIDKLLTYERPTVDIVETEGVILLSGSNTGNSGTPPGSGDPLAKPFTFDDYEGDKPENVFSK